MKKNRIVIFAVCGAALCAGLILLMLSLLQKNNQLRQQDDLLKSIQVSDGILLVDTQLDEGVDFYDEDEAEPPVVDDSEPYEAKTTVKGIGVLEIPKINLKLPVAEGVRSTDLKVALGHAPETASIGSAGNAVIAGHRSYTYGHYFNRLDEVQAGDEMIYTAIGGAVIRFSVFEILVVEPADPIVFKSAEDSVLTLLTCTPMRKATHRLIVRGLRVNETRE